MLVSRPGENSPGRVTLLVWGLDILRQHRVNRHRIRIDLSGLPRSWCRFRRYRRCRRLPHCSAVNAMTFREPTNREPLDTRFTADLLVQLHPRPHLMPTPSLASQPTMGLGHSNPTQHARRVEVGPIKLVRTGSTGTGSTCHSQWNSRGGCCIDPAGLSRATTPGLGSVLRGRGPWAAVEPVPVPAETSPLQPGSVHRWLGPCA